MARHHVRLTKTDSILDEIDRLQASIRQRAYDLFCGHDGFTDPLGDWLSAERELVGSAAVELRQKDGAFELEASIAGIDPKDLDVQVTPEDILIKGHTHRERDSTTGAVTVSDQECDQIFRSIHLPERIDPDSVKAEHRNGLLHLTARIAAAAPHNVDIQAA